MGNWQRLLSLFVFFVFFVVVCPHNTKRLMPSSISRTLKLANRPILSFAGIQECHTLRLVTSKGSVPEFRKST